MKLVLNVLRKTEYKNCTIYILQFHTAFQYLFLFQNEIYQRHVILTPRLIPRILWWIGRWETPYSKDEMRDGEEAILSGALTSIDALTDPKNVPVNRKNPKDECIWQTREHEITGVASFYCIEHSKWVEWKDGQKPFHKKITK